MLYISYDHIYILYLYVCVPLARLDTKACSAINELSSTHKDVLRTRWFLFTIIIVQSTVSSVY